MEQLQDPVLSTEGGSIVLVYVDAQRVSGKSIHKNRILLFQHILAASGGNNIITCGEF